MTFVIFDWFDCLICFGPHELWNRVKDGRRETDEVCSTEMRFGKKVAKEFGEVWGMVWE
jgi:hypothetical protein